MGVSGRVSKEEQREADKNLAGIVFRSFKNQEDKAKKDTIGMNKPMFNM